MERDLDARHPNSITNSRIRWVYKANMSDLDPKRGVRECAAAPDTPVGDPLKGYLAPYDPYVLLDRGGGMGMLTTEDVSREAIRPLHSPYMSPGDIQRCHITLRATL